MLPEGILLMALAGLMSVLILCLILITLITAIETRLWSWWSRKVKK
jgi:hypothetical protein